MNNGDVRHKSPVENAPHMVIPLSNGHMLLTNDSNRVIDQHTGVFGMSEETKRRWVDLLRGRKRHFLALGLPYNFLVVPDKISIFWELFSTLPDCSVSLGVRVDSEIEDLFLFPKEYLQSCQTQFDTHPKTDSHWSDSGALQIVNILLSKYGTKQISNSDLAWADEIFVGDLGKKCVPQISEIIPRINRANAKRRLIADNNIPDNGRVRVQFNAAGTGVLVLFGDSYSYVLADLFSERFQYVVHAHGSAFDFEILKVVPYTHVLSELCEKFMIYPPAFEDSRGIQQLWSQKREKKQLIAEYPWLSDTAIIPDWARKVVNLVS